MPSPNSYLVVPKEFGQKTDALWKDGGALDAGRAAAYFQHLVVCEVNDRLPEHCGNDKGAFAVELGVEASGLRKKLAGDTAAQMSDYLAWAYRLGRGILPDRYGAYPERIDVYVPRKLLSRNASRPSR